MASTYVNDLRLNEMATGDASGSWGTVTNTNLELIGEAFSYGTETIGDADSTLTIADGAADAARSFYLKITSSVDLTTTRIVTLGPNTVSKVWMIENATTGSQVITIKQGSGATINVPNGQVKMISTDGAGSGGAVLDLLVDVDLTGTTTLVNLDVSGAVDIAGDLTLSAGGDGALRFTAASSVKVLDNDAAALVFEEADNAYMTFVTTDGSEAVKFDKALDINAATQIDATVTVGVDDTGYDVKFFGATTGKSLLWDESADSLIVTGTTTLVGTTNLDAVDIDGATQIDATVTVGVDDTGYDVKFFGATAGKYMLWDESADTLEVSGTVVAAAGTALLPSITTTGDLNTGMWFPAADTIAFSEGGVEALRIDSSGNVGIGVVPSASNTLTPSLQIGSGIGLSSYNRNSYFSSNAWYDTNTFKYTATDSAMLYAQENGDHIWSSAASGSANASITFSESMRIMANGNVNIGSSSDFVSSRLQVNGTKGDSSGTLTNQLVVIDEQAYSTTGNGGSISFGGNFYSGGQTIFGTIQGIKENNTDANYASAMAFATRANGGNLTERMRIDSSGNVGIGTGSPSYKLHVRGADATAVLVVGNTSEDTRLEVLTYQDDRAVLRANDTSNTARTLAFETGTTERMRIDSSGNVLVGKTNISYAVEGIALRGDNSGVMSTVTDEACFTANRLSSDGS
jgi:hypothetical protein